MEEWKKIKGYPRHEISNFGRVKNLGTFTEHKLVGIYHSKPRILKTSPHKTLGYCFVSLSKDKKYKKFLVHRLVAEYFIKGKSKYRNQVNHIDSNRSNNHHSNLEWVTPKENQNHAVDTHNKTDKKWSYWLKNRLGKLNPNHKPVNQLDSKGKFIKRWESMSDASRATNIPVSKISRSCKTGIKTYQFKWKKI